MRKSSWTFRSTNHAITESDGREFGATIWWRGGSSDTQRFVLQLSHTYQTINTLWMYQDGTRWLALRGITERNRRVRGVTNLRSSFLFFSFIYNSVKETKVITRLMCYDILATFVFSLCNVLKKKTFLSSFCTVSLEWPFMSRRYKREIQYSRLSFSPRPLFVKDTPSIMTSTQCSFLFRSILDFKGTCKWHRTPNMDGKGW